MTRGITDESPLMTDKLQQKPRWLRRLAWMVGLWAGGVVALWVVASLIRALMHAAGMR